MHLMDQIALRNNVIFLVWLGEVLYCPARSQWVKDENRPFSKSRLISLNSLELIPAVVSRCTELKH